MVHPVLGIYVYDRWTAVLRVACKANSEPNKEKAKKVNYHLNDPTRLLIERVHALQHVCF